MTKLRTILLADDNQNDVELSLLALSKKGLANRVTVVNDGVEVLEYLKCEGKYKNRSNGHPTVILLDIKMPRMNGIDVLAYLKSDPFLKLIPVVMLTSSKEEPDLQKCYELGVNAYITKPIEIGGFIEAISNIGVFWALLNEIPTELD